MKAFSTAASSRRLSTQKDTSSAPPNAVGKPGYSVPPPANVTVDSLVAQLNKKDLKVFQYLAAFAEFKPESRSLLLSSVPAFISLAKTTPIGSPERQSLYKFLRTMVAGDDVDRNARRSVLQVQMFSVCALDCVEAIREEAKGSVCKDEALEALRRMSRNYSNKPKMFEIPGFFMDLLQLIDRDADSIRFKAYLLVTTLATDGTVADAMMTHFGDEILNLLQRTLTNPDPKIVQHGVRLAQNLSQHDVCVNPLRESDVIVSTLAKLASNSEDSSDDSMQALMCLANLIGTQEEKSALLRGDSNGLLKIAALFEQVLQGQHFHFTADMVLRPLKRLCAVDENRNILSEKLLPLLSQSLEISLTNDDKESLELGFGVLSQLSFDAKNLEFIQNNAKILEILDKVYVLSTGTDTASNEKWLKVARAADVLKFNVSKKKQDLRRASISQDQQKRLSHANNLNLNNSAPEQTSIMISYQWKYQDQAKIIATLLEQQPNTTVWIDIQKMKANVMESMAEAVSSSTYVFMLVSETYKNSSACKCEAMFAYELKKTIIPLVVEKDYIATGWLGILIAGKLRYDFSDKLKVKTELPRVLKEISPDSGGGQADLNGGEVDEGRGSFTVSSSARPSAVPDSVRTVGQVCDWLGKQKGLEKFVEKFRTEEIDGEVLMGIRDDFACFSDDLKLLFEMDLKDRVRFKRALNTL